MLKEVGSFSPFGAKRLNCPVSDIKSRFYEDGIEIDWYITSVIWSKHNCLLHHLTMTSPIKDALICNIDNTRYLAVLCENGLTLFSFSGQSFLIPLPFQISKIFAFHKALLLVRSQSSSFLHPQYADFPVLFSLLHPLEEIRPVALHDTFSSQPQSHPRFTTVPSPSPRRGDFSFPIPTTPVKQEVDDTLCFITDSSFDPIHVSNERGHMIAKTETGITAWKIFEPVASNRDILFASPHLLRSPSIFSPPKRVSGMVSPGASARADIQATLEGIPPDLFIESIADFTPGEGKEKTSFCEISDGKVKYLLFVHDGILESINISYVDNELPVKWIDDVQYICKYDQLMYFVIRGGKITLFEENREIAEIPKIENVTKIEKLGRHYILTFSDGKEAKFKFSITNDKIVHEILKVAHTTISSNNYAAFVLSLSTSDALENSEVFFNTFYSLLKGIESEQTITSFFFALHLLFEELKIHVRTEEEQKKLLPVLIRLAKNEGMGTHLLYYVLHAATYKIPIEEELSDIESYKEDFQTPVADLLSWCSECVAGKHILEFSSPFPSSYSVATIFNQIPQCKDAADLVKATEKEKLKLHQVKMLQPAISVPLLRAFELNADTPPKGWPVAAYRLIGRDDISKLIEYTSQPVHEDDDDAKPISLPDLRFLEVERLLQSHIPVTIDVERPNGTDDIVYQSMMVSKLRILLAKQWSLSIGRGMFNLRSIKPLPSQKLVPVELNDKGYHVDGTEIVDTDEALQQTPEYVANKSWSVFHNGVSDGLTVITASHSWLVDTITSEFTPYTAGVLFGFAMNGLLKKLWKIDIFQYLTSPDIKEINAIAMVFGLGISYRGSKDLGISHMLTMHIPELRDYEQSDYEMSSMIKSAAILGIGFLFESSGNRHLTEVFIQQLQKSAFFDISALPLALGCAVGLISLGMGDSSVVLKESRETLCAIFEGSKTPDICNEKIATFGNSDFIAVSPAAILALALGYMRTDHERVRNALALPEDPVFINRMVPDVVLFRTAGALMIDSDPLTAINFSVPDGLTPDILASLVTGFAIACGVKFAGSMNKKAFERLITIAKCLALFEKTPFDFIECSALHREICLCAVVLAASYVVAGTCDVTFLRFVRLIRRRPSMTSFTQYVYGMQSTLAMAIGVLNLGKGRFTLGQSNSASAALLLAIYPRIARTPGDNEYALQPMKHLINAAAVPRVLELRDVETNEIVNLMMTISMVNDSSFIIHTPHVLPPFSDITGIYIDDERYYSVRHEPFPYKDESVRPIIWVKKRKPEEHHPPCNEENMRAILKMKQNPIFKAVTTEDDEMAKVRNELLFDEHSNEIVEFFRCTDFKQRINIISNSEWVRKFLQFFGIPPSAKIEDLSAADDEALAFIIPCLTEDELKEII